VKLMEDETVQKSDATKWIPALRGAARRCGRDDSGGTLK
jgi:hypothetical protein